MATLYNIQKELSLILDELSICEDDARAEELMAQLDRLEGDKDKKLFGLVSAFKNLRGDLEAFELEASRMKKAKESIEKNMERIEGYLKATIGAGNKWQSGVHSIGWRYSERCVPKVDAEALPECYQRVKLEANVSLMKEDLKLLGDGEGPVKEFAEIVGKWNVKIG